jgi:hypothetical protein
MPTLSISCVETRNIADAARAVEQTLSCVNAKIIYWFSTDPFPISIKCVEIIHIYTPQFSNFVDDINKMYLFVVPSVVTTDFNLIVQADGYAVNKDAWTDDFFQYDFIGAPWPWMWGNAPYWAGPIVGNGGFSLRSRRLYEALLDLSPRWQISDWVGDPRLAQREFVGFANSGELFIPEDLIIGLWYRGALEKKYGIKFCPPDLANRFSVETIHPFTEYWLGKSFGFHGSSAKKYFVPGVQRR